MNQLKGTKINRLLQKWPKGAVYTASWLGKNGVRFDLLDRYCRNDWLYRIGHGAVARKGDKLAWTGAVFALQNQLQLTVHPGGKTALQMAGLSHYVPLGRSKVFLFGAQKEKLPGWFKKYDWNVDVQFITTNLFPPNKLIGVTEKTTGDFSVKISSPERAIMEILYLLPDCASFDESKRLMEALVGLRPGIVQELLENCGSVKVKRLFLALAEEFNHAWFRKLKIAKVSLGKGKRFLFPGGYVHPKYFITLPKRGDTDE
jgi:hypothetical protein